MSTDIDSSVFVPDELHTQKVALAGGEKPRATVREVLGWFNAARRGNHAVRRVRAALDALQLVTDPDFEGEYIDQEVFFMHKTAVDLPQATTTGNGAASATIGAGASMKVFPPADHAAVEDDSKMEMLRSVVEVPT